jgi:hypothetical protein
MKILPSGRILRKQVSPSIASPAPIAERFAIGGLRPNVVYFVVK